jgi:hypothetical protein
VQDNYDTIQTVGHTALDIVGMIPVVGEVADGANALWYLADGDMGNAALSAAALVPIAGSAISGAKLAAKVIDKGIDAAKTIRKADEAVELAKTAEHATEVKGGVYTLTNSEGAVVRTGRTGRTNDLARRQAEHRRHAETKDLDFNAVHRTDNRAQQRGLEQTLYDAHPTANESERRPKQDPTDFSDKQERPDIHECCDPVLEEEWGTVEW